MVAKKFSDLPGAFQSVVLGVLAVLLAGLVFWYFVWPLSAQLTSLRQEVDSLHAQNQSNKTFEREHAEYLQRIAQSKKQLESLRSTVPEEAAADAFVKMVHDAAVGTTVHVRTFVAQPLVAQDMYTEMPFKVHVDGTYYALRNFFSRLAQGQRIVGVTNLALGAPAGGGLGKYTIGREETVGANCLVTTYFSPSQPRAPEKR